VVPRAKPQHALALTVILDIMHPEIKRRRGEARLPAARRRN
jgi:hypothetical protein